MHSWEFTSCGKWGWQSHTISSSFILCTWSQSVSSPSQSCCHALSSRIKHNNVLHGWLLSSPSLPGSQTRMSSKGKFHFWNAALLRIQKIQNFCLAIAFRNSRINLGISNQEKQNSLYNSRNLYEIFRKFLKNPKLILEIPRFIRKFRNAIAKQNSGIFYFQ